MMLYGIDVSDAQHGIDISALSPRPDFVIVKSTGSGGLYVNPDCDRVMQQCFSLGIPCANYDFARDSAGSPGTAQQYADGCASNTSGYRGKAGFAIDWESVVNGDPLMADAGWATAALQRLAADGVASPGFYIDYRTLTNGADWSKVAATGAWKWRASYVYGSQEFDGFGTPDWSLLAATPAWPDAPAIWQYTSSGHLGGWDGALDFNAFDGDLDGIKRLFGITGAPQENDMTPEQAAQLAYVASPQFKIDLWTATNGPEADARNRFIDSVLTRDVPWYGFDGAIPATGRKTTTLATEAGWATASGVNNVNAVNGHVDAAVKGIALTPTDAQVQALADRLGPDLIKRLASVTLTTSTQLGQK